MNQAIEKIQKELAHVNDKKHENDLWIKLGELLGKVIAPIVMGFVFFLILTPISLLLRIFKKDLLKLNYKSDASYWIKRDKDIGSMKKQF